MKKLLKLLTLIASMNCSAQQKVEKIELGEKVPESIFKPTPGKLTILDFWNILCTTCIEAMPKMEQLEQQYKDQLEVILVTYNSQTEVDQLFKRTKRQKPELKSIVGDSVLRKSFPHSGVPHHVWIDSSGVVKYITFSSNATPSNIDRVLKGEEMNFAYKNNTLRIIPGRSLLDQPNGSLQHHIETYSIFFNYLEEISQGYTTVYVDSSSEMMGLRIMKAPLLEMYEMAFGLSTHSSEYRLNNRKDIRVNDSERLSEWMEGYQDSWRYMNIYGYESRLKTMDERDVFERLQEDLLRDFEFDASIVMKPMKALVLIRTSTIDKIKTRGGDSRTTDLPHGGSKYVNASFKDVVVRSLIFRNAEKSTPFIDRTNYTGQVDINIEGPWNDIANLNRQLKKYDLVITEEFTKVPILVIRDKKKP
ncbi:MAG: TlpA family protein disulfide reductase [Chitinophagaceae bacterium]|nr:TlpA family protein disulfide reductase [Chitinophagaceae bacterium]